MEVFVNEYTAQQPFLVAGFEEHTPHPEGADRGGSCCATHLFNFRRGENGVSVEHEFTFDVDDPENFVEVAEVDQLQAKVDAVSFIESEVAQLRLRVTELEKVLDQLKAAENYEDLSDYAFSLADYDEDDEAEEPEEDE